jgi:hypothetical protein
MLVHKKQFYAKYRMPYPSFMKLVKILEPYLLQSECMGLISCGQLPISPGHILGLTIDGLVVVVSTNALTSIDNR